MPSRPRPTEPVRAALFDLDRTIVTRDTASLFVRYERSRGDASALDLLRVAWWMACYTVGALDAERVAAKAALRYREKTETWLSARGKECYAALTRAYVSDEARRVVEQHQNAGALVAIVTSGTEYTARPLADDLNIEHLICSRMEVSAGAFTGRVHSPLCYGAGKVTLARALAAERGFALRDACFYSDSITDLPLLEAVGTPIVVNPDARLRSHAKKQGWRIERWR
jgi:HAD superfamily hydrolase (TIGR01490 family)